MSPNHILLVDDDPLLRRSLAFNLERGGYTVSTAASAEDALALLERHTPDLVLLDIGLPGMDGLEALRHIRERMDVPVIFLTARRRELEQVLGLELGADDYRDEALRPGRAPGACQGHPAASPAISGRATGTAAAGGGRPGD